ncbi:hypothetical protein R3I93_004777 [Phoxinus phoxinus]|uniref:Uncharacterized protein n=1 Tax=Phoxinus phoxinus TaxID=58324 RepID=A0AAN9DB06_9TELE
MTTSLGLNDGARGCIIFLKVAATDHLFGHLTELLSGGM